MANRQTRSLLKKGLCTNNVGAPPNGSTSQKFNDLLVKEINHGRNAFHDPAKALNRLKDNEMRTWKVSKKHPAHDDKRQAEESAKYIHAPQVKTVKVFHFDSKETKASVTY